MPDLVLTFFYGGLMNNEVMDRVGLTKREQTVASVPGFRIQIQPWVNLVRDPWSTCFGILMETSHADLANTYSKLAVKYLPFPVIARTDQGLFPALTYLAEDMESREPDPEHVAPLLETAQRLDFPAWYVDEIRSFLSRN